MTTAMEFSDQDQLDALGAALTRAQFTALNPPDGLEARAAFRKQVGLLYAGLAFHPVKQLQAQALMRRAERLLGQAAVDALARGEVITAKTQPREGVRCLTDFMPKAEWTNGRIRRLAACTDAEFEQALSICVAGGSASMNRLLPLVSKSKPVEPKTTDRESVIRRMANEGHSASSIGRELGIDAKRVRELARHHDINLRAERLLKHRSRVIDAEQAIETTINSLEDLASGLAIIENVDINPGLAKSLAKDLSAALRPFAKLQRKLTEEN